MLIVGTSPKDQVVQFPFLNMAMNMALEIGVPLKLGGVSKILFNTPWKHMIQFGEFVLNRWLNHQLENKAIYSYNRKVGRIHES